MIGSVNAMSNPISQMQANQANNQVSQVNQNIKTSIEDLKKTDDNKKKVANNAEDNSKLESSEKTKDTENLMDTLGQNENRSLVSSSSYAQANDQANRVSGMQAYNQNGKSVFNFS